MKYKEFRESKGWTQAEAADHFGVSLRTYARYEANDKSIEVTSRKGNGPRPIDCSNDNFKDIIEHGAFYVDKTRMIEDLVSLGNREVTLFTRPRRFGKSLNLSMLYHFFSNRSEPSLFDGLYIKSNLALCKTHQNAYPCLLLSLKDAHGETYEDFLYRFSLTLSFALSEYSFLLDSEKLSEFDREFLEKAINNRLSEAELSLSFKIITRLLHSFYQRKAIIFVDEYDVPLEKASGKAHYDRVLSFLETLFSSGFKSNPCLNSSVITGCLRSGKENLFTGFNNAKIFELLDYGFSSYFGFTEEEVLTSLQEYGLSEKLDEVRSFYDGYRVGESHLYCPFDVANYLQDHLLNKQDRPKCYWRNTSSNALIYQMILSSSDSLKSEIEDLIEGKAVEKEVDLSLSHRDIKKDERTLWSLLLSCGYLTIRNRSGSLYSLAIPNQEIMELFKSQILLWMQSDLCLRYSRYPDLLESLLSGNASLVEMTLNAFLKETIGIHDFARQGKHREAFYHGLLLGLLSSLPLPSFASVRSNKEGGEGFEDIAIEDIASKRGLVLEIKYAENEDFDACIESGFSQAEKKGYGKEGGVWDSYKVGVIAFYKKRCKVVIR